MGDGAVGAAVDELVDVGTAAPVDVVGAALPDQTSVMQHRDPVGDLAGAHHVVG